MYRSFSLFVIAFVLILPIQLSADEALDPRRPAAITTEEVPVVPEKVFERLNQYSNIRGANLQGWAPDGNGILVSTRFANSSQLHRVYTPGGRREQVTFFEEPVSGGFIPKATDGSLLLSMSVGGNENYQVYLLDRLAFTTALLTDGESRNSLGAIRDDGGRAGTHHLLDFQCFLDVGD